MKEVSRILTRYKVAAHKIIKKDRKNEAGALQRAREEAIDELLILRENVQNADKIMAIESTLNILGHNRVDMYEE